MTRLKEPEARLSIGHVEFKIQSRKLVEELLDVLATSFKRDTWHPILPSLFYDKRLRIVQQGGK
jgi:hypothetical protein